MWGKKSLSTGCSLRPGPISIESRTSVIWHVHDCRGSMILIVPYIKLYLYSPKFKQVIFFHVFIPQSVHNPILYTAIITLWLVKFPHFLIISGVSEIIVVSFVVPVTACLFVWCLWETLQQLSELSGFHITECEITVSVCIPRVCRHHHFWDKWLFSSSAGVLGYQVYQLHIKRMLHCIYRNLNCGLLYMAQISPEGGVSHSSMR